MVYACMDWVGNINKYYWNCWIRNHRSIDLGFGGLGSADLLTVQYLEPRTKPVTHVPRNSHLYLAEEEEKN